MGRNLTELVKAIKNVVSKDVSGATTIGDALEKLNLQYDDVVLTLNVVDADGEDIASPTIVLKTGATVGSGDAVTAEADGTYKVKYGKYNVSVSKTGYVTKTAIIDVDYTDAKAEAKEVTITLNDEVILTINVVDADEQDIALPTIILKIGETVGSGTAVTAENDGTYKVEFGKYNVSVAATGYVTQTAVIDVDSTDAAAKAKTVTITLAADAG